VRIRHHRALEFVGSLNLLLKVSNFDIRLPESDDILPNLVGFGQNGWNPIGRCRIPFFTINNFFSFEPNARKYFLKKSFYLFIFFSEKRFS